MHDPGTDTSQAPRRERHPMAPDVASRHPMAPDVGTLPPARQRVRTGAAGPSLSIPLPVMLILGLVGINAVVGLVGLLSWAAPETFGAMTTWITGAGFGP